MFIVSTLGGGSGATLGLLAAFLNMDDLFFIFSVTMDVKVKHLFLSDSRSAVTRSYAEMVTACCSLKIGIWQYVGKNRAVFAIRYPPVW